MKVFTEMFYFRFSTRKIFSPHSLITDINMKKKEKKLQNLAVFFTFTDSTDKLKFLQVSISFKTKTFTVKLWWKKPQQINYHFSVFPTITCKPQTFYLWHWAQVTKMTLVLYSYWLRWQTTSSVTKMWDFSVTSLSLVISARLFAAIWTHPAALVGAGRGTVLKI